MQSLKNGCLSCRDSYKSLPLGYKFYIILVITSITLGSFIADWQANLSNNTTKVIEDRQYWRLLTSLLSNGLLTAWNIILVILCLWLLKISMTSLVLQTIYLVNKTVNCLYSSWADKANPSNKSRSKSVDLHFNSFRNGREMYNLNWRHYNPDYVFSHARCSERCQWYLFYLWNNMLPQ